MSSRVHVALIGSALAGLLVGCGGAEVTTTEPPPHEDHAEDAKEAKKGKKEEAHAAPAADEGEQARVKVAPHDCKGMNECKGQGGCGVEGANTCHGQNECKGKGGCKVDEQMAKMLTKKLNAPAGEATEEAPADEGGEGGAERAKTGKRKAH